MSRKSLPYKTDSEFDIVSIIKTRHEIPYHSRHFMWDRAKHIETIVQEIIKAWSSDALYWLGFLIVYDSGSGLPAITDGQHRVTVCFLMILALSELAGNDEPLQWISRYGTQSILGTSVPPEDQAIMDKYEWTRFPNIHSVYDYDFEALGALLNRQAPTPEARSESMLYDAYDSVKDMLRDIDDYPGLLRFIHADIKVTRMTITNWQFAMTAFNSLNNIKVRVPASFLLKNLFTLAIGEERSEEIHDVFRSWEKQFQGKYESMLHLMLSIFVRRNMNNDEYEAYLAGAPELPSRQCPFQEFQECVAQGVEYRRMIHEDRFGKILMSFVSGHEIMSLCLLPLAFVATPAKQALVRKLLRQLVAYGIRQNNKFTFNPMKLQALIRALVKETYAGEKTIEEACSGMTELLNGWLQDIGSVKERIAAEEYRRGGVSFSKARASLLYLAEVTDHHEASLDHSKIHVDHIYAKTPGKSHVPLADKQNTHRLGNLTLLLGANSEAGMKGNSSLSNKVFLKKVESYAKSNLAMTRNLAELPEFMDAQINERSHSLAQLLDDATAADLG